MFDFNSKVTVITGAAGALGRATAEAFHAAGARLALIDLDRERLQGSGPWAAEALLVPTDLTKPDSVEAMAAAVLAHYGRIDVLVNIAGGFTMGPPLHETPVETWDFMLDLNARSVFLACRAVVPHMLARGEGKIVNIGARAALQGKGKMGPYIVSKAAVLRLTETLAAENRAHGVNVNCILPGTIDTPQNRGDMPDADFDTWVPPAALADAIQFLASDAARAVHGAALPVYGLS